ncbi:hypothetical protein RvY_12470-1 [Ramazzottius varieornatus]|uniref:Uncharacterized protein n=1 Tax=Ramazzottius varieornatus TaxID=947166 RepID=A0A1D1VNT6_RAMVA|nr:hypothetical protein RvY_12470-1 [Ramazzottius varieornatus]
MSAPKRGQESRQTKQFYPYLHTRKIAKTTFSIHRNVVQVGLLHYCHLSTVFRKCLSSQPSKTSAQSVARASTLLRKGSPLVENGTRPASSAVCATSCWTRPTSLNIRARFSAVTATAASTVQRELDSVEVLVPCPWTPVLIWVTPLAQR